MFKEYGLRALGWVKNCFHGRYPKVPTIGGSWKLFRKEVEVGKACENRERQMLQKVLQFIRSMSEAQHPRVYICLVAMGGGIDSWVGLPRF